MGERTALVSRRSSRGERWSWCSHAASRGVEGNSAGGVGGELNSLTSSKEGEDAVDE